MAALAGIAFAPPLIALYAPLLMLGGGCAGCVTVLAPALVAMAAGEHEQGDALALSGMFRAMAQLGAPALVSASLAFVAIPVGVAAVALAAAAPGVALAARRPPRPEPTPAA
jgi:hypothetical protein